MSVAETFLFSLFLAKNNLPVAGGRDRRPVRRRCPTNEGGAAHARELRSEIANEYGLSRRELPLLTYDLRAAAAPLGGGEAREGPFALAP